MSKILILGQGNIGTFLGAAFKKASHEVAHYLRNSRKDRLSVIINCSDRRSVHKLNKGERYVYENILDLEEITPFEYIIVPVSHRSLLPAIKQLSPYLDSSQKVVIAGNVWSGFEEMEELLPCKWFFAFPNFGGAIADGKLEGWLTPGLTIGGFGRKNAPALAHFKVLLEKAGFRPRFEEDIVGWLKTHFAYNGGMLLEAARHGGYANLSKDRKNVAQMYRVIRDFVDHAGSLGVAVRRFKDGQQAYRSVFLNSLSMYLIFRLPGIAKGADANFDEEEWRSYAEAIVEDGRNQGLDVSRLEKHLGDLKKDKA